MADRQKHFTDTARMLMWVAIGATLVAAGLGLAPLPIITTVIAAGGAAGLAVGAMVLAGWALYFQWDLERKGFRR